ncbi:MAG: toprim domain-containing protein [Candidatus Kapabacteria bacterium]|jgi:twinkle protein|nr:toprim domain-containing protein [Ignavibacteriota bacterium]MCW5884873.1 toprim domain-containing protein [Candidatus Kapabacteria bacterium]
MSVKFEDFGVYGIDKNRFGEQRTTCPKCSSTRKATHKNIKCLSVNPDKGNWFCHHCGYSGGLFEKKEVKYFLPKPVSTNAISPTDKVYDWFTSRKITKEVINRNKITIEKVFLSQLGKEDWCICFNYYVGEILTNIKYRNSQKVFQQVKGGSKVFYKLNDLENQTDCIITEGEIDALSFEVAGFQNVVSVPDGGINPEVKQIQTKLDYLDNCSEYFKNMHRIYLATDSDAPGIRLREELARRLGKSRCWIVRYPNGCKDANDVLVKYGSNKLKECINNAELYPIEGIHYANDRRDELKDLYDNGFPNGAKSGYSNLDELITFYGSQLTIITGIPSHGKSNFMDQLMIKLAINHNWRWGIFSPENSTIEIHLLRLIEILVGKPFLKDYNNRMTFDEVETARDFINDHTYFILPDNEEYRLERILEAAGGLVLKHGIKGLILDPWNTLEHQYGSDSETIYTGKVLNQLKYFARIHDIHLFLVAHPRKMARKKDSKLFEVPTLYDISGSANWFNIADNGMVVYRQFSEDFTESYPIVYVQKVKHKFIGKTGFAKFDFDVSCQRYIEKDRHNIKNELDAYVDICPGGYPSSWMNDWENKNDDDVGF